MISLGVCVSACAFGYWRLQAALKLRSVSLCPSGDVLDRIVEFRKAVKTMASTSRTYIGAEIVTMFQVLRGEVVYDEVLTGRHCDYRFFGCLSLH